jgi:hypothetical protein
MLRSSVAVVVVGAALAAIPAASAKVTPVAANGCPSSLEAQITEGTISKISLAADNPQAALADPIATYKRNDRIDEQKGNKNVYTEAYVTTASVTLDLQSNIVELPKNAFFYLGCYGQHAGGPLYPMISLRPVYRLVTEATLKTTEKRPAAFKTATLLSGPEGLVAQTIHLTDTRTRSTISSLSTVTITPQIGPKAGHCFYPHKGRVWRTGRTQVLEK